MDSDQVLDNASPSTNVIEEVTLSVPNNEAIKADFKREAFDKEFRSLIKQCKETITAKYGMSLEFGNSRPELICLNKYLGIYNNTKPEEHYAYLETIYNKKRTAILGTLTNDNWLRNGNLVIQFGDGIKVSREQEERRKQIRVMLSAIFLIAVELQEHAEKVLEGIDNQFIGDGGKDLIRPNILLLHLMRIFYHLNDGSDKAQLGNIVTQLENDLGVTKKTVGQEPWNMSLPNSSTPGLTGGLKGIMTMATAMMEKFGIAPPPGMTDHTEEEINNVVNNVFNNEVTQNALQGMLSSLKGAPDLNTAFQKIVTNIADPKTMEAIQQTVVQTANNANTSNENVNL